MALVPVVTFGLMIGSFLNVVIARLPERRSLWMPGSTCPGCGNAIAWHDNIPLVSFVALRGRCRACAAPIPWRYPIVEASTAVLFAVAWLVSPIDLVPEFIPVAGPLDDAIVAALVLRHVLRRTDRTVLAEHWRGEPATLDTILRIGRRKPCSQG